MILTIIISLCLGAAIGLFIAALMTASSWNSRMSEVSKDGRILNFFVVTRYFGDEREPWVSIFRYEEDAKKSYRYYKENRPEDPAFPKYVSISTEYVADGIGLPHSYDEGEDRDE